MGGKILAINSYTAAPNRDVKRSIGVKGNSTAIMLGSITAGDCLKKLSPANQKSP